MNPVFVELLRGDAVESVHHGAVAVVDADGAIRTAIGDVERPVFARSAVKLLQALPLVESGAADRLALTDEELAVACASHGGEERHVRAVAGMLAKAGVDAATLECGAHWPLSEAAARALAAAGGRPNALHNNCSGKHAGFVCLARRAFDEAPSPPAFADVVRGYVGREHPVMREVTAALQAATGFDPRSAPCGVDGCSIPAFAIPLRALALGFARAGSGVGLSPAKARAAKRLRLAIARNPFFVAGSGRFDTRVMERLGERVCCKAGAEGVYCAALPARGLGVAIKVDDGHSRAAEVAMAAAIEALVSLDEGEAQLIRRFSDAPLVNWNGIEVGRIRATPALRRALAD